jgi:hypothetical protein
MGYTEEAAVHWLRCGRIDGFNPIDGAPSLIFQMERATRFPDGGVVVRHAGVLGTTLSEENAGTVFEIDGETYTYAQVHKMLYGLMLRLYTQQGLPSNAPVAD